METYVLWHTLRQGWISRGGTTSTDFLEAQRLSKTEAIGRCIRAKGRDNAFVLLPVKVDDAQEVSA